MNPQMNKVCDFSTSGDERHKLRQERKLRVLKYIRDAIERRLASVNASIETLEKQIERDNVVEIS